MAGVVIGDHGEHVVGDLVNLSVQEMGEERSSSRFGKHGELCAICLDKIELEETALVKGCEHAYCVTCILRWATYKEKPTCPQCKHPLEFLNIHRSLDGSLRDYMFEESVRMLLRASWFEPLVVEDYGGLHDDLEDYIPFEDETYYDYDQEGDDDLDDDYFNVPPGVRIGNRRWGENGYVRAGRLEARPSYPSHSPADAGSSGGSSSSRQPKKKEAVTKAAAATGRRAKRALKREAADKAAAAERASGQVRSGGK